MSKEHCNNKKAASLTKKKKSGQRIRVGNEEKIQAQSCISITRAFQTPEQPEMCKIKNQFKLAGVATVRKLKDGTS
jgi:hypothetical protein